MNIPDIFYIEANVIIEEGAIDAPSTGSFLTYVEPFRGLAFCSPLSHRWCSLRAGTVLAADPSDEVKIFKRKSLRASLACRMVRYLPMWALKEAA